MANKVFLTEYIDVLESGGRPKGGVTEKGDIPSLGAEHLGDDGRIDFTNKKMISDLFYSSLVKGKIETGDILIVKDGATTGKVAFVNSYFGFTKAAINEHVFRLKPTGEFNAKYLFYYLFSKEGKESILKDFRGATVGGISKSFTDNIKILLPPLETQKKIVSILDIADELRQNDKKILLKLDQLARSIFIEIFGDLEVNNKNWQIKPFSFFARIDTVMTTNFKEFSNLPHVGIANIEQNSGKIHNVRLVKEEGLTSGKYIFSKEHIIYSKIRPNLNKVALPDFDGLCSADAYPILVHKSNTNRIFFTYILRSKLFLEHILKYSQRTNIPKANKLQVESFHCIAPPKEMQDLFAHIVMKIEEQKALSQQSLQKSEELFQSLLQRAFSGNLI
jgi:type I restriction enzyme S subunit